MSAHKIDAMTYDVDSRSRGHLGTRHRVELDAWDGNGECVCEHFQWRLLPMLKAGAKTNGDNFRCHHIKEAREEFVSEVMSLIKDRQKENGHARKNAWHNS
jgi:hypothetical protein